MLVKTSEPQAPKLLLSAPPFKAYGLLTSGSAPPTPPQNGWPRPYIKNAARAAAFATHLTQHLLDLARGSEPDADAFNLNACIRENDVLLHMLMPRHAALTFDLCPQDPLVVVNRRDLQHALLNLVTHAAGTLAPAHGRVVVQTHLSQHQTPTAHENGRSPLGDVQLRVTGSGAETDPAMTINVFKPFCHPKTTGKGMGLKRLQQMFVGSHNGITVASQPDRSTTYTLTLPFYETRSPYFGR